MNDLDTRLRDSLQSAGRAFDPNRSPAPSPGRFKKARRRRMFLRSAGAVAVTAVLIVTAILVIPTERASDDSVPIGPAPIPEGPIEITARIDVSRGRLENAHGIATDESRVFVGQLSYPRATSVDPTGNRTDRRYQLPDLAEYVSVAGDILWGAGPGRLVGFNLETKEELAESLPLGQPTDLVSGDGFIWVATSAPHGRQDRYVVYGRTADDLSPLMVAPGPIADTRFKGPVALDYGYGALWLTQQQGGEGLFRWDPGTGELQSIPGITSASDVAVGAGGVWVYENSSKAFRSRLLRIDPETLEVEEKAIVLGYFAWLEADENGVWVLNASDETDRRLLRLEPATGDSMGTSLRLGAGPFEMTSGFGSIWITDEGKGELLRVDVVTDDARTDHVEDEPAKTDEGIEGDGRKDSGERDAIKAARRAAKRAERAAKNAKGD